MSNLKRDAWEVMLESLITGDSGTAIENQEKRGQTDFVNSTTLPKEFNTGTRSDLERRGVKFHEDYDDLFVNVELPPGWKKEPTEHSMWSNLLDEKGNVVATIFYKAAFYDRSAFINVS